MNDAISMAKRAREVFEQVSEFSADIEQQTIKLDAICKDDAALKDSALQLLKSDREIRDNDFLFWSPVATTDNDDPYIGTCLGDFRLLELIGSGATGLVYYARRMGPTQQEAAIKILRFSHQDSNSRRRFELEKQALARLSHTGIARLMSFGQAKDGTPYLVMEYIDGQRIDQVLAHRSPSINERMNLFLQLAEAMAYSHQRGILHRDLKPANILITSDNRLVITDFGIVKLIERGQFGENGLTATGGILGTPGYMAPEQQFGTPEITTATDVYGLGAVLFFLLTNKPPISSDRGNSISANAYTKIPRPTSLVTNLDKDIEVICLKCLEVDPSKRYLSVPQLIDDIRRQIRGIPIEAREVSRVERVIRWAKRNQAIAGLLATLALTFSVAAVWISILLMQSSNTNAKLSAQQDQVLRMIQDQFDEVSDWIKQYELTDGLSDSLLEKAEQHADEIEDLDRVTADGRKRAAVTYFKTSKLAEKLGNQSSRIDNASKALELFSHLALDFPEQHQFRFDMFHCHLMLRNHEAAFQIISKLNEEIDDPYYRDAYAASAIECGRFSKDLETRDWFYQRAYEVAEPLAQEFPRDLFFRRHFDRLFYRSNAGNNEMVYEHSRELLPVMEEAMQSLSADNQWVHDYTIFASETVYPAILTGRRNEARQIVDKLLQHANARIRQIPTRIDLWILIAVMRANVAAEDLCADAKEQDFMIEQGLSAIEQARKLDSSNPRIAALESRYLVEFFNDDAASLEKAEQLVQRIPGSFGEVVAIPALIEFNRLDHAQRIIDISPLRWQIYQPLIHLKRGEYQQCRDALAELEHYAPLTSFQNIKQRCLSSINQ